MIDGFKSYPGYKDSGVPWMGKVPEHWELLRLGGVLRERGETNDDNSVTEVLSVMRERGVIPYAEKGNVGNKKSEDITRYKIVRPDDIVVNCMNVIIGSVGLSKYTGCLSPVYYVLTRRSETDDPAYLNAYFQTKSFQLSLVRIGNGILAHRMRIPMELLKCEPFPRPPANEQADIVRFLDHANRRIRRYIHAKQKLIKLLEEQKQAIIHRAVTRGLDANLRLKPSGVEWLGDVPEHWEVLPLRRVTIARCDGPFGSGLKSSHYTSNGIRVVRLQNIGHAAFQGADAAFIAPAYYATLGDRSVEKGDVLVAGLGDERHPAGRACFAPASIVPAMVKADCFRFRLDPRRVNSDFAALHLTATAVAASAILSTGATRQRTNLQSTASRAIGVPPLGEQEAILAAISNGTTLLSIAIDRAHREISLLREYRTRLIADVVTGKLDVSEAASRLPQEAPEIEPLDEIDDLPQDESAAEDAESEAADAL